jgi:hypothetical protein
LRFWVDKEPERWYLCIDDKKRNPNRRREKMKKVAWKTMQRKMRDGEMEVNAWGRDNRWADVTTTNARGDRKRQVVEVLNWKPER